MGEFEENVAEAIDEEAKKNTIKVPLPDRTLTPEVRARYAEIGIANGPMQDWFHELVVKGVQNEIKYLRATAAQEVYIQTLRVQDRICEWLEECAVHAKIHHHDVAAKAWCEAAKAIKNKAPFSVRSRNQILAIRKPLRIGCSDVIPSTVYTEL